jgi:histidinol phosphatase-like enzyme
MKPNPGMIEEAKELFGMEASDCIMIGDAWRDLEAAARAGVKLRILVESGYGKSVMGGRSAPAMGQSMQWIRTESDVWNDHSYDHKNDTNKDNLKLGDKSLIFPFYYAKNLYHAVESILHSEDW